MMDFNERVIPGVSSNFMFKEALARYEFASRFINKSDEILDLGCGTGYGTKILAKKGSKILGVDINSEAIKFANKKYKNKNISFKVSDIAKFNTEKTYDVIVSFEVIEHLKNPKFFLKKINKMLKNDGIFILSTPNAEVVSPKGGVASPYHEKEYSYIELESLLTKHFDTEIYFQSKSKAAKNAWSDFMKSQTRREGITKMDKLGFRKFIPASVKEYVWKYLGNFVGRRTQETLDTGDFPINIKSDRLAYYFVALCQKYR